MKSLTFNLITAGIIAAGLYAFDANAEVQRACCHAEPQWYAAISGSVVFLNDVDISHTAAGFPAADGQTYDIGYGFSGAVGYNVLPDVRAELEVAYRTNQVNTDTAGPPPSGGYSSQESLAFMANAYYDLHNTTDYTPYFGAGIGGVHAKNPRYYINGFTGTPTGTVQGWGLAYQFMTGVSYAFQAGITPLVLNLGYRYFTGQDIKVKLHNAPGTFGFSNDSHNFELGGRIYF